MKCFHPQCDRIAPKHTLYRINTKGVCGICACIEHKKNTDAKPLPDDVDKLIKILESRPFKK